MNWKPISEKPEVDEYGYSETVLLWISESHKRTGWYYRGCWYIANDIRVKPTHWCEITPPSDTPAESPEFRHLVDRVYSSLAIEDATVTREFVSEQLRIRESEKKQPKSIESSLAEALEELMSWQNGPPLSTIKWTTGWNAAMDKAHAALALRQSSGEQQQEGKNTTNPEGTAN